MMTTTKKSIATIVAAMAVTFAFSSAAQAVPSLQVYIPGATYDPVSEGWITTDSDFEVWVIASEPMYNVELTAALGAGEDPYGGSIDIGGTVYSGADFTYGPHSHLNPHGVFPADWINHAVGDMTTMTANTITDFTTGYEHGVTPLDKSGQIIKFDISIVGFTQVNFDIWGFNDVGRFNFAPFSHNGGTGVPEPASVLLFSLGAAGMGVARRFRKK